MLATGCPAKDHAVVEGAWVLYTGSDMAEVADGMHGVTRQTNVLDMRTHNGDEPVGEITFPGQSCLSSTNSC